MATRVSSCRPNNAVLPAVLFGSLFLSVACGNHEKKYIPSVIPLLEAVCTDGFDNDQDGRADCDDPDCQSPGGDCKAAPALDRTVASTVSELSHNYMHRLYKVLTPEGAKTMSVLKLDYDPLSAWSEIRGVTVYHADGTQTAVDTSKVLDYPQPARAIYWGAREKMIEIGRLEPGDAVEVFLYRKGFTYALLTGGDDDERYIPPMKGHFYDIVPFYSNDPILSKVYRISVPDTKVLQYEVYNGEVSSKMWRIRKANGATTHSIVRLLLTSYTKWLTIAFFIALPVAFLLGTIFLGNFHFHTPMPLWAFLVGPFIASAVALSTVFSQTWSAASRNPINQWIKYTVAPDWG